MSKPLILVTNDDGIQSRELAILVESLEDLGEVRVYAPDREQSAVSHGISLHRPLRVTPVKDRWFMVDGTPTDCVLLAVRAMLDRNPDLVVSGINTGPNLGDDVTYSGTVAGAFEGMLLGIPAFAISHGAKASRHAASSGRFAARLAGHILEHGLPEHTMLNVNVPDLPYDEIAGVAITRMGRRYYEDEIIERRDPRGVAYYWIGGAEPGHVKEGGTDFEALEGKAISVTPLHRDLTNHGEIEGFKGRGITK